MGRYILARDQGTSGLKLMLSDLFGEKRVSHSESYETFYPKEGHIEQDPSHWWEALCRGVPRLLQKAGIAPAEIAAIGVDGISWTPVMVDKEGNTLGRSAIWNDTRSTAECLEIEEKLGKGRAFEISGNPNQPYYTTPKLLWYKKQEPERFLRLHKVLSSNGYLVYKLTGAFSQDASQAYGWCFYDMEKGVWDTAAAEALGIDLDLLPPLCESMDVVGAVTGKAAAECGLAAGIPVVAGGLDAACGVLGAGVIDPGPAQEQSGSAGGMSICIKDYKAAENLIMGRHVVPKRWLLQGGTVGGGGVFSWLRRELYPQGDETANSERTAALTREAESVPCGSEGLLFLPYMAGERSPIWDPRAKGVWYGLDFSKSRGHLIRAAMEGVAYSLRHNLEEAALSGAAPEELRAVGGASASSLWMQMKADITGCPIRAVAGEDATAVGAIMLAAVGAGEIESFEEACRRFVSLKDPYYPDPENRELCKKGFEKYKTIYESLKGAMKEG